MPARSETRRASWSRRAAVCSRSRRWAIRWRRRRNSARRMRHAWSSPAGSIAATSAGATSRGCRQVPELPEVETIAPDLESTGRGATVSAAHVHRADVLRERTGKAFSLQIAGATFDRFWRRAKYVVADLSTGDRLVVSPRFTGALLVEPAPFRRAQAALLHGAAIYVLRAAVEQRGTSFRDYRDPYGGRGGFLSLVKVYGREGEPCERCGTTLRSSHALENRVTVWCTTCQK